MQIIVVICALMALGAVSAAVISETAVLGAEWEEYKMDFDKYYDNLLEEERRFEIFKENKLAIAEHNLLYASGKETYEMGLNAFSDMTAEELREKYTMNNLTMPFYDPYNDDIITYDETFMPEAPESIDWRSKGAITPVKNQGQCGSCWAFAAIGSLEAQHFIKHHRLVSLSEQNLLDCSRDNYGCGGGWPAKALQYVQRNHGVDTESSYRYTARQGQCHFNRHNVGATVTNVFRVNRNEESLKTIVGTRGPVTVAISIANSFFHHRNGVYNEPNCRTNSLHAILVTGYGTDPHGGPFWWIKNSWGGGWGEQGFAKLARNKNICGITNDCVFPEA